MSNWNWKDIVGSIAPTIGAALGGPLGAMAAKKLSSKLLGRSDATEEELGEAIVNATPEQLVEIKRLDTEFKKQMKELDVDLERIAAGDRDSARKRQAATDDKTPQILAYIYTFGLFAVMFGLIGWGDGVPEGIRGTLQTAMGVLFAMVYASKDYFFGSSAGSARKTELIRGK